MEKAGAAVLLISADFLTSGFILGTEVPRLLERQAKGGLRIIPLIVRPCPWRRIPWLSEILCRPKDGRALAEGSTVQVEKDLSALAEEIADLLPAGTTPGSTHQTESEERGADLRATVKDLEGVALTLSELVGKVESLFTRLDMASRAESLSRLRLRLETKHFKLIVLGEFKRGKSTLINALLSDNPLPTNVLPCTAVITNVRWGREKQAIIHFRAPLPPRLPSNLPPDVAAHLRRAGDGPVPFLEIPIEGLKDYIEIPKEKNPAEAETPYERVEIWWPLELCRNGVEIIDTPGLRPMPCCSRSLRCPLVRAQNSGSSTRSSVPGLRTSSTSATGGTSCRRVNAKRSDGTCLLSYETEPGSQRTGFFRLCLGGLASSTGWRRTARRIVRNPSLGAGARPVPRRRTQPDQVAPVGARTLTLPSRA